MYPTHVILTHKISLYLPVDDTIELPQRQSELDKLREENQRLLHERNTYYNRYIHYSTKYNELLVNNVTINNERLKGIYSC